MSQLKSIEYNNDGTMDITDDTCEAKLKELKGKKNG